MTSLETHLRSARDGGRKLLVPYVTGGLTADWTDYILAYQDAGADAIEIGLPFSDPMLDGVTIQVASDRALERGATIDGILADVHAIRARVSVPLVAMTYANLVVRRGEAAFCAAVAAAGVSGLIVPDVPLDEAEPLATAAADAGIALVLLAAPSTAPARLREICERSRGFVYAVSVMGTTGERDRLAASAGTLAARCKQVTDRPVLVGFGVSTGAQARAATQTADGVVVASALIRKVLDGASAADLAAEVDGLRRGLDGPEPGKE